jgi:immune inhibitor A
MPHRLARSVLLALALTLFPLLPARAQWPEFPSTLEQVLTIPLPARDPLALAARFDGTLVLADPPASPVTTWAPGDTTTFWADDLEADLQFQVQATLEVITPVAYVWVESGVTLDEADLQRSAEVFSSVTYPTVRAAFGSEANPGIDGDPRLHVLLARGLGEGTAAYFGSASLYPAEAVPGSNEREMFFVNLDSMASSLGSDYFDGVLAHEFQHMIHHNNDANEDAWLDEGMAELASLLAGFDWRGFAPQFLQAPGIQLTTWPEVESTIPHYGAAFLFATYFHERFGDEGTRLLVTDPANGMASVDAALEALGATDPVSGAALTSLDIFADWTAAILLNNSALADGRFGYTLLDPGLGTATVQQVVDTYPAKLDLSAAQYSATYVTLRHMSPGRLRVQFAGAESVPVVDAAPFSGARMWYSNRGDTTDSSLTRAFDLNGVKIATLEFALWYDIEALWDYGYVMASCDGGDTWTPLATARTTTEDPHGNAYGPGYTGDSGGDAPAWVQETVDLTPFAGGEVLIRFELITDEAVNAQGMLVDDVRIPEIGYFDDFESGPGGWESQGWLYIDNVLPQRWIVQAVRQTDAAAPVTRLLMAEEGVAGGSWEFEVGGAAGDVTLIISPVAPLTTEPGAFRIAFARG